MQSEGRFLFLVLGPEGDLIMFYRLRGRSHYRQKECRKRGNQSRSKGHGRDPKAGVGRGDLDHKDKYLFL